MIDRCYICTYVPFLKHFTTRSLLITKLLWRTNINLSNEIRSKHLTIRRDIQHMVLVIKVRISKATEPSHCGSRYCSCVAQVLGKLHWLTWTGYSCWKSWGWNHCLPDRLRELEIGVSGSVKSSEICRSLRTTQNVDKHKSIIEHGVFMNFVCAVLYHRWLQCWYF